MVAHPSDAQRLAGRRHAGRHDSIMACRPAGASSPAPGSGRGGAHPSSSCCGRPRWRFSAILSVVRAQALEPLFGGLDAAVRLHRKLGLAALLMLVSPRGLLAADAVAHGRVAGGRSGAVLVKGRAGDRHSSRSMRSTSLGILAYDRRLRHERWLALHRLIGLLFVLGTLHAAMEPGTILRIRAAPHLDRDSAARWRRRLDLPRSAFLDGSGHGTATRLNL